MFNRFISFVIVTALFCNGAVAQAIISGPVPVQTQTILPLSAFWYGVGTGTGSSNGITRNVKKGSLNLDNLLFKVLP